MPMFVETLITTFTVSTPTTSYMYELMAPQRGDLVRFHINHKNGTQSAAITATLLWGPSSAPANNPNAYVFTDIHEDMLKITSTSISAVSTPAGGYLNPILPYANPARKYADIRTQADLAERLYLKLTSSANFSGDFQVVLVVRVEYA